MKSRDLNEKIKAGDHSPIQTGNDVIVVTPTYAWRIPRIVSEWLSATELTGAACIWFVMDCGSEIGNAAKYNRRLAEQKHLCYMGTAQMVMPENYIAMFDAPQVDKAKRIVEKAEPDIVDAIARVRAGKVFDAPRNNLYDRFMQWSGKSDLLPFFRQSGRVSGERCLHRLWAVCEELSDEQHQSQGQKARMGQGMHTLHGVHLLLSREGDRVREKEYRKTALSL